MYTSAYVLFFFSWKFKYFYAKFIENSVNCKGKEENCVSIERKKKSGTFLDFIYWKYVGWILNSDFATASHHG